MRVIGYLQDGNRVKELERKRNWLFVLTLVYGLLTLGLLAAMMWNLMMWLDAKYAIGAGLGLTIGITIIELINNVQNSLFRDVAEYIELFNSQRIHQKQGYKTPDRIEEMYRNGEIEQLGSEAEA